MPRMHLCIQPNLLSILVFVIVWMHSEHEGCTPGFVYVQSEPWDARLHHSISAAGPYKPAGPLSPLTSADPGIRSCLADANQRLQPDHLHDA